jgi:transcriptional regulator with XRE-family HTH domain
MAPTANERIRAARERAGLQLEDVAGKLEISYAEYWDIEAFEDEVWTSISLETLQRLARTIGSTLREILDEDGSPPPVRTLSFADFVGVVQESVRASGGDVEAWGERAGWDVEPLLRDPDEIWNLSADGLRDVAKVAGIDWRSVLPD